MSAQETQLEDLSFGPRCCEPLTPVAGLEASFRSSRAGLGAALQAASSSNIMANPYHQKQGPITTSIFDLFKIGPGPSSSHTIGPMKSAFDFLQTLRREYQQGAFDFYGQYRIKVHLHGSLSLTGKGHGSDRAVVAGLLGWMPATCCPDEVNGLLKSTEHKYRVPVIPEAPSSRDEEEEGTREKSLNLKATDNDDASTVVGSPTEKLTSAGSPEASSSCGLLRQFKHLSCQGPYYPLDQLMVDNSCIIWHEYEESVNYPHPNTMIFELINEKDEVVMSGEYYSVGGGFIQKKDCPQEDARETKPIYPYVNFEQLKAHLAADPTLTVTELMIRNEMALTGATREEVYLGTKEIMDTMEAAVLRGIKTSGMLPGSINLQRKAKAVYERARGKADILPYLNAYCLAASEENAAGNMVVTAPTSGSSGVYPGLLHFMKHHLFYEWKTIADSMIASCAIGFIIKRNASIAGAEMGCMGEIGVAASMGAFMLAAAAKLSLVEMEAAAEIAMEHHLGLTCDPIAGYVMIPCIERNPMGAVKAYNAFLLSQGANTQKISFDQVIVVMRQTGVDMDAKYKETSRGGLAKLVVC